MSITKRGVTETAIGYLMSEKDTRHLAIGLQAEILKLEAAPLDIAALQARVAEPQNKVKEFTEVFDRQCRIILYDDGSGHLEYWHPDHYIHAASFETVAEFMSWDAAKLKEALNL